jgi:hypothetical protein
MILLMSGSEFIEADQEDSSLYIVFLLRIGTEEVYHLFAKRMMLLSNKQLLRKTAKTTANNKSLKHYDWRCPGEYAAYHGGTKAKALAAMNATLTRVNGIFNKDLAVRLILITNNDLIIYTNAVTDPYSDTAGAGGAWSQELQDNLTTVVQMGL